MSEVHSKLNEIQQQLKAPKGQFNSFAKFNYRSCEDILEAVKPLLGIATLTLSDEVRNIGTHNYIVASAILRLEGDTVCVQGWAREAETKKGMDDSQITGTSSSYARKYALNGLFCIDDTKDADTMDNRADEPRKQVLAAIDACKNLEQLRAVWEGACKQNKMYEDAKNNRKAELESK